MQGDAKAKLFVTLISLMGLALLALSIPLLPLDLWQEILLFASLCAVAQLMPVYLFQSSAVSVAFAITFAGLVILGPVAAIWINLGGSLVSAFRPKRKPLHKIAFNISNHTLATATAGVIYIGLGGSTQPDQPIYAIFPTLAAGITSFLIQTLLLATAIAFTEHKPIVAVWKLNFQWSIFNFLSLAVVGLGLALGRQSLGILGISIFCIPLAAAWYSFKLYMAKSREVRVQNETLKVTNEKLEESYLNTIKTLAAAVDAKDHYTHGHSETTMRYAVAIARQLGLNESEVAAVQIAALFHDVGKIGIPDGILNKPSQLAEDEWKAVKEHPIIGAKLIDQIGSLASIIPGILYHHERYDGKGYPSGLRGDQIPLVAQIIAVADSFQAMTSTRPYRRAFSVDYAVNEIKRCSGTQFSPRIVEAFIEAMEMGKTSEQVDLSNPLHLFQPQEVRAIGAN